MKIVAIGRNYSEHVKKLNNPLPEGPIFFENLKPLSATVCVLTNGGNYYILSPMGTKTSKTTI